MLAFHLLRVIPHGLFSVLVDLFVSETLRRAAHDPKCLLKRPHDGDVGEFLVIGALGGIRGLRSASGVPKISQGSLKG